MILFGDGERIVSFDVEDRRFCEKCAQERDFFVRLRYRYGHFYHLFGWVIDKQYQLACPTCTHGWILDSKSAEDSLGGNPIPFRQRSGWLVGVILAHVVALGVLLQPGTT
jgi:hypothetical protein